MLCQRILEKYYKKVSLSDLISVKMKKIILSICFIFTTIYPIYSATCGENVVLSDYSQISVLTNSPWEEEVYAVFGHTAIRVCDPENNLDVIFNYGIFDFSSPNFIGRFIKGETDYRIAATDFDYYMAEYQMRGVGVMEQVLNLNQNEKQKIWEALLINLLPENAIYRYNYFYDNCSTRARDIIEKNIDGKINYNSTNKLQTYRDLVHECVAIEPWLRFGIDLVIGADADKVISDRQKDFLPKYLMNAYQGATVVNKDATMRKLVAEEHSLTMLKGEMKDKGIDWPLLTGCFVLFLAIFISFVSYRGNRFWIGQLFDTLLFVMAGAGGCIIFFLMFFSIHPCVNPNWNIAWLNPLQLLMACLFFVKPLIKYLYYYHFINFAVLMMFLLAWGLIPQYLEIAFVPYILALLMRSGMNIWLKYNKVS